MPREPIPLIRQGGHVDAEKLFVLSYEGTVTEKKYFQDFRASEYFNNNGLIEIVPLKRPNGKGSDPFSVKKLLNWAKKEYGFKISDEFWLIVDRDDWESIHKLSFDDLVAECKKEENFYLAMSNPCFEIWLVLHLKNLSEFTQAEQDLLLENAKVSSSKNHIDIVVGELQGGDRGYNKRPNPNIYLPLTNTAIQRAKSIDTLEEDYPKSIGTHLYKLIEKLINNESPSA
ncbi:MAG: RloB domain-containing protein [Bacteroidetes bacterium]|nr:RloB domain-containing protein [Bacteroidota bacterium]MBP9119607.1 RloB domain-containing protein [Ignavibacterium sp.]